MVVVGGGEKMVIGNGFIKNDMTNVMVDAWSTHISLFLRYAWTHGRMEHTLLTILVLHPAKTTEVHADGGWLVMRKVER